MDVLNAAFARVAICISTWLSCCVAARKTIVQVLLTGLLCGGCLIPTYGVYFGGYHVSTEDAKLESFRPVINQFCDDLVLGLGKNYAVISRGQDKAGFEVSIQDKKLTTGEPFNVQISIIWGVGWRFFCVTIYKCGSDETPEVAQIRRVIEETLRKYPTFKWEHEISHSFIQF